MSTIKAYPKKERSVSDVTEPKYVTATEPSNDSEKLALDVNIANATAAIAFTAGALQYNLDGVDTEVSEDTVTPANSKPLPVKLVGASGDINITAGDLNVAIDAANDSVRLGDGTNLSIVNASGELLVKDGAIETGIAGLQLSLDAINTELDNISLELADVNTELDLQTTALNSLDAKDFATETSLSALNAKVTSVDTTGKSTEAKQDSIILELQDIELDVEATNTKLDTVITEQAAQGISLDDVNTELDSQTVILTSLDGKDYALAANQTTANASLANIESDLNELNARLAGNLVPETFDYLELAYVTSGNGIGEIETVIYKTGGAAGTTVATLTLAYDVSNNLTSVTRS